MDADFCRGCVVWETVYRMHSAQRFQAGVSCVRPVTWLLPQRPFPPIRSHTTHEGIQRLLRSKHGLGEHNRRNIEGTVRCSVILRKRPAGTSSTTSGVTSRGLDLDFTSPTSSHLSLEL